MNEFNIKQVKLHEVYANKNEIVFVLSWASTNYGFGQLSFCFKNDNLFIDDETLGKEFVMNVLEKFVSDGKLSSETNDG